ncbi:MAG: HipA N-terminal domain-containing protein [Desulfobulbaceae bacterium]|nr:HipA N-terminal domain-containing protein [Desulfobulbaceae bacterium]
MRGSKKYGSVCQRGNCGTLEKTHRFSYSYDHSAQHEQQISLTMPVRLPTYSRGALHPVFEQNLPEGFVQVPLFYISVKSEGGFFKYFKNRGFSIQFT